MAQKLTIAAGLKRFMERQLSMAWESWQAWYFDVLDQREKLDIALRRLMNRHLSMGWLRYCEWYDDALEQQRMLVGGLNRFLKRELSKAWESWQAASCPTVSLPLTIFLHRRGTLICWINERSSTKHCGA